MLRVVPLLAVHAQEALLKKISELEAQLPAKK